MSLPAVSGRPVALHRPSTSQPAPPLPFAACAPFRGAFLPSHRAQRRLTPCTSARSCTRVAAAPATTVAEPAADISSADVWDSFAANVSGEWEGVTASFEPDGTPIPLPEYYVPQAYRDWGVELFDWQTQSSMLADATCLTAKNRRMMPTVGCEADAIAYTQEAARLFGTAADGTGGTADEPATVAPDGSYSTGPADLSAADCFKAAVEHCLALPAPPADGQQGQQQQQQQRMRVRVVHNLQRRAAGDSWRLADVEVHSERYDTPYRGKLELSGCGGGMKAFATGEALAAEALAGSWEVVSGLRYAVDSSTGQASGTAAAPGEAWAQGGLPEGLLLHPLRCWSACNVSGESGCDVSLAAGVLLGEDGASMAVAARKLAGGRLVAVELLLLQKASA